MIEIITKFGSETTTRKRREEKEVSMAYNNPFDNKTINRRLSHNIGLLQVVVPPNQYTFFFPNRGKSCPVSCFLLHSAII